MYKKKGVITDNMTLKERVKLILVCLFLIVVITGAMIFSVNTAGESIIDIFKGGSAVYYDWRAVLVVLYFPVMVYFDLLIFLFLFFPFTFRLAKLWGKLSKIIFVYIVLAFFLTLPVSLYIFFFPLADYHSCGLKGPFSGVYYVKELNMCEQFEYHPDKESSDADSTSIISGGKK